MVDGRKRVHCHIYAAQSQATGFALELNFDDEDFFYDSPELLLSDSEDEEQEQEEVEVQ
jgi:hypothetical protein